VLISLLSDEKELQDVAASVPAPIAMFPEEFEKDDDTNYHMDFIVSASNLRATNYGITLADKHKVHVVILICILTLKIFLLTHCCLLHRVDINNVFASYTEQVDSW